MMSEKVDPDHLARKAILYVRQSSTHQVLHNRRSQALQHAMRDRLVALGRSEVDRQLTVLPTADIARVAWRDYGEVILCAGEDEMIAEADRIAADHVEVPTSDPRRHLDRLKN